jgi:4-amino-4-deoxychorismate lyase
VLLETIRCEGAQPLHLSYHQRRLDATCQSLGISRSYDLESLVIPPDEGLYRCRFLYDATASSIEFHPYVQRTFSSLKLVNADAFDYPFKYADRSGLDHLFQQREGCDDVLILQDRYLKDTTIANVALRIGGIWMTPEQPLLGGTTRARLIDEGFLIPAALRVEDIAKADKVALMNAMMGFVEVEHGIIF